MRNYLTEFIGTFFLCLTIGLTVTHGNSFYGLAIGFTVVVAAFAGGPISGGAFNPAVGFGPIIVDALLGGGSLRNLWLYIFAPLAGGALAAAVFGLQERTPVQLHAEPSRVPESRPA